LASIDDVLLRESSSLLLFHSITFLPKIQGKAADIE
jgi:hypothetical protein